MTKDIKKLKEEIELLELQKRILELKQAIRSLEDEVLKTVYPYGGTITISNPMPNSTVSNAPYLIGATFDVPSWYGGFTYTGLGDDSWDWKRINKQGVSKGYLRILYGKTKKETRRR